MNRSDVELRSVPFFEPATAEISKSAEDRRLVVVMLDAAEEALLAGRILALAEPRGLRVLLIGVAPDPQGEAKLRRKLATIAAFLKDHRSPTRSDWPESNRDTWVEYRIEHGKDWIARTRALLRPNDMLACYSEQVIGTRQRPLSDILSSTLNMSIYTFTGLHGPEKSRQPVVSQALSWIGSLAAVGGSLLLQARIVTAVQGGAQTALLLLTVIAEVGLIWVLNSLFA